jgi:LytS/YehU family sensor histidine kinase
MVKFIYPPSSARSFSIAAAAQNFFTIFDYWIQIYWLIVLVVHAMEFYQRSRANEWKAAQLESRLAQAQLQALKTQLNPHFLFNTLNAVSALMHRDVRAANRMMTQLSDLLRLSLETSGAQEVPLKVELDFLDRYVEIQRARFPDRLHMSFEIQPETLDALVPSFILQPLVENAIRHGIAQSSAPGSVEVTARVANGLVELVVRDNGAGFPAQRQLVPREGVGLSNTRARLRHLYGAAHRFELRNVPTGGAEVLIVIPFRPAESSGEDGLHVAEVEYIAADAGEHESSEGVAQPISASGEGRI